MGFRGLFVGINAYSDRPLKGCVNDTTTIRDVIKTRTNADDTHIRLLTDDQATLAAIKDGLGWLAQPLDDGTPELRVFHYAGHGIQQPDTDGDEPDGTDECLVPIDYQTAGTLSDDILRELYAQFAPTSQIVLLMDCCHSGTISKDIGDPDPRDIRERFIPPTPQTWKAIRESRYQYKQKQLHHIVDTLQTVQQRDLDQAQLLKVAQELLNTGQKQGFGKADSQDNVILLSACKPEQTAADANFAGVYHGAMTYYLLQALSNNPNINYEALAEFLRRAMYDNKFRQVPQLECHPSQATRSFLG